jgi:hypothetical protein
MEDGAEKVARGRKAVAVFPRVVGVEGHSEGERALRDRVVPKANADRAEAAARLNVLFRFF